MHLYRARMRFQRQLSRYLATFALDIAPEDVTEDLFRKLGERRNVAAVLARGENGLIRGALSDLSVFGVYLRTGSWGRRTVQILNNFFSRDGGTFIDAGANIGLVTIPIAQNPNVNCFAFEPEPLNYSHLAANVFANCSNHNVQTLQLALCDRHAVLDFELDDLGNSGDHRIRLTDPRGRREAKFGEERRRTIQVKGVPLDEAVVIEATPLAVKVDTQGAEPLVIAGGRRVLSMADLMLIEWGPYWLHKLSTNPEIVTDFVVKNFSTMMIAGREDAPFSSAIPIQKGVDWLLDTYRSRVGDHTAYWDVMFRK